MKRFIAILAVFILAIPLTLLAVAKDDPDIAVESGPATLDPGSEPNAPTTVLALTVEGIQQDAWGKVQDLSTRLTSTIPGTSEAVELQRRIEQVKVEAEVAILEAIIADSLTSGDEQRGAEAEAALDQLLHPEKYSAPSTQIDRPAPSN